MVVRDGDPASFLPEIDDAWFVAEPSVVTSSSLALLWRRMWRYNAHCSIVAASEGLGQSLTSLQSAVRSIDVGQRLEPRLSARLAALMEAMQRRDGYAVYDTIQAWCVDPPFTWSVRQIRTESIAMHEWERFILAEVRGTRIENMAPLTLFPLLELDIAPLHDAAMEALGMIHRVDPSMHAEIEAHVSVIKLFAGPGVEGFSSPKAFGAIWLRLPDPGRELAWFLEHLVHECSHLHLNALLMLDPLLLNPNELHQSPIRPDPRPLFQILHGTFVLARNCRVHRRLVKEWPGLGLEQDLGRFEEQLSIGTEVLRKRMNPTVRGARLLESLCCG